MDDLPNILQVFEMKDVFNCDETSVIFKQSTNKSLVKAGDTEHGYKEQKERVTLLLCGSCMGEEMLPMIGKSKKAQLLKGADFEKLSI